MSALCDQHWNELLERDLEITKLKEDLKEVKVHEVELKAILQEKNSIAAERSKELLEVKHNLDTIVERIEEERREQKHLVDKLQENIDTLQSQREDLEFIINEKQTALLKLNDKFINLENELKFLKEEKENHFAELIRIEQNNSEIVNRVITDAGLEIAKLERDLNDKVELIEQKFNAAHRLEEVDFHSKLNLVSYEFEEKKMEMQSKMEECFKQLEELEKLVNQKSKDFSNDIKESDERCKYMYRALCKVEKERDDLLESDLEKNCFIMEVQGKCKSFEDDLHQYKTKCKQYEVTLCTMQSTVEALSVRLLESENEVERLNNVENNLEEQRNKLEEDILRLLTEVAALRNGMDKMENDIINDVTALKEQLAAKVENLKIEGMKQVNSLHSTINEKQRTIEVLLKENNYHKKDAHKKEKHITDLYEKLKKNQEEVLELRHCCSRMEEDFNEKLSAQKNIYKIVSDKLQHANEVISELQNLKSNNENLIIVLNDSISKLKIVSEDCKKEVASLKEINVKRSNEISELRREILNNKLVIESQMEKEAKQQQYLDTIISDYEAEKKKYSALELDNDKVKTLLSSYQEDLFMKTKETEILTTSFECLQKSLKEADEKYCVLESENHKMKALLCTYQDDINNKTKEIETLAKSVECLQLNLKKAEDTVGTLQEKIVALENQLAQESKYTSEGSQIMMETIKEMQSENEYLQLQLSSAKENMETETAAIQHENINKAELIVELSIKIDCLEAEKSSLAHQLEEANSLIDALKLHSDDMNRKINSLTAQQNLAAINYEDNLIQIEDLHETVRKYREEQRLYKLKEIKLTDAEERINALEMNLAAKESDLQTLKKR